MNKTDAIRLIRSFLLNYPKRWRRPSSIKLYSDYKAFFGEFRKKEITTFTDVDVEERYFYSNYLWGKFGIDYVETSEVEAYVARRVGWDNIQLDIHIYLPYITSPIHLLIVLMHEIGHVNDDKLTQLPETMYGNLPLSTAMAEGHLEEFAENWMKRRFWYMYYKLKV